MTETVERPADELDAVDIDAIIAEQVMSWKRYGNEWRDKYGVVMAQVATDENRHMYGVWKPSVDDGSAFRVVDKFKRPRWQFRLEYGVYLDSSWSATFSCDKPVLVATASAPTRQLSICRAAYKAVKMRGASA